MSVKKLLDLSGKIARVPGGSRGLGLQIAEALGEMGAKLAITARKADELEEARDRLDRQRIEALALPCDLSKPEAIEPMPMSPREFGAYIEKELARYSALARERKIWLDEK